MTSVWMPGARVRPAPRDGGSMTGGEKLVTWHYFVSPESMSAWDGAKYLNDHGTSVHLTFNVRTGEVVQMIPANRAGRGLLNAPGGVQTNRRGTYNIQIEVMANGPDWWKHLTPEGKAGLARMMAWFRALGIPDQWAGQPGNDSDTPNGRSGHTGHRNWRENDHGDYLSRAPWDLVDGLASAGGAVTTGSSGGGKYLTITGDLNAGTIRVLQRWLGTPVDGVLSSPSRAISALQVRTKAGGRADGIFGPNSARALEAYLGVPATDVPGWYPGLIRALQRKLNDEITAGRA